MGFLYCRVQSIRGIRGVIKHGKLTYRHRGEREQYMKKYELRKNSIEVSWKNRKDIKEGITLTDADQDPVIVKAFDAQEDALEALQQYTSSARQLPGVAGVYYLVEEYYVEENEYDEYGEWITGGDVLGYARLVMPGEENE